MSSSLSFAAYDGMQPEENEFAAAEYLIRIIPKFSHDVFHCITGDFGRFDIGVPVEVPIWMALRLREDSLCQILPPSWMSADELADRLRDEKEHADAFVDMPFYYTEITWLLLSSWAREDIPQAEKVGELVQDIEAVRKQKLYKGIKSVLEVASRSAVPTVVDLTNISASEVAGLRYSFFKALDGIVEAGQMQVQLDQQRRSARLRFRPGPLPSAAADSRVARSAHPQEEMAEPAPEDAAPSESLAERRARLRDRLRGGTAGSASLAASTAGASDMSLPDTDPGAAGTGDSLPDSTPAASNPADISGVPDDPTSQASPEPVKLRKHR